MRVIISQEAPQEDGRGLPAVSGQGIWRAVAGGLDAPVRRWQGYRGFPEAGGIHPEVQDVR